jgi:hypothetical protein
MCGRCDDDLAIGFLTDGRVLCRECVFTVCNELLREREAAAAFGRRAKPTVSPAMIAVTTWLEHSTRDLDDAAIVTIDGKRSIAAHLIRAFLAEVEGDA